MIINNNIKSGQRYSNATRYQIVEVIQVIGRIKNHVSQLKMF